MQTWFGVTLAVAGGLWLVVTLAMQMAAAPAPSLQAGQLPSDGGHCAAQFRAAPAETARSRKAAGAGGPAPAP